jgi:putative phage-type endonuclease
MNDEEELLSIAEALRTDQSYDEPMYDFNESVTTFEDPNFELAGFCLEKSAASAPDTKKSRPVLRRITSAMQMNIIDSMRVKGPEHIREVCSFPQRSAGWFKARTHIITGSKAGSAVGMNPYQKPDEFLRQQLWPSFKGNKMTRHGTAMERFGAASCLRLIRTLRSDPAAELAIPGLILCEKEPILGYSADGVVLFSDGTRSLVEIKTPWSRKPYKSIPKMYWCQIQLGMYILDLKNCYFVVYCGEGEEGRDDETHITEYLRDDDFINNRLLPSIRQIFFRRYLPLRVCFDMGALHEGQCYLPHGTKVDYLDSSVFNK